MRSRIKLQEIGEDEYETEIAKCTGVTGYHRWFFLNALSESLGLQLRALAVEKDGATIGVLPIVLKRRGPVAILNHLPVQYLSPLVRDAAYLGDVLAAAEPYMLRHLVVAARWAFAPGAPSAEEALAERGFRVTVDENFFVPADRSPEDQLAAMRKERRRDIKAWQARGVTAGPADPEEIRDWFAERVGDAYRRQGAVPAYSPDACRLLVDLLGADPRMLWRSIRDEHGRLIAVNANIIGIDRLCCWLLAGDHGARPSPHVMAYWDVIEWSLTRGLVCDLGCAPSPGIGTFKLSMGAESESWLFADRGRIMERYTKVRDLYSRTVIARRGFRAEKRW